ncbi:LuxR C-terminal-related transcriptional regulator [Streptomyces sp. NBC_01384]|uniref:helix-turn-helix transcriptional regulator n=1 Tax=Streptomyces sp. NBC_01384 TaxID=2903847 RepID=UPI00325180F4
MLNQSLYGRSEPMSHGLAILRRTERSGRSAIIHITGESGIGKSALLSALCAEARTLGFAVATGRAAEVHLSPAATLLLALRSGDRPLLDPGELADLARLSDQPVVLLDRIGELLEGVAGPTLIAIDDIEMADELSRAALAAVPPRLVGSPIVWLVTSRDDRLFLGRSDVDIRLDGLVAADILQCAKEHLSEPPTEAQQSMLLRVDGNPELATQLIKGFSRGVADRIPEEFIESVRRRVNALRPAAADLVRIAAVLNRPFAVDEVSELLPGSQGIHVEAALASGLFAERSHQISFRHDLVRETVYAGLSATALHRLHRACADFLLSTGHSALTVAPHVRHAVGLDTVIRVEILRRAADEAVISQPRLAAELAREAFGLLTPDSQLWREAGEHCLDVLSKADHAAAAAATGDALLAGTGDPEDAARLHTLLGPVRLVAGQAAQHTTAVEEMLASPKVTPATRVQLHASHAWALAGIDTQAARGALPPEDTALARRAAAEIARHSGHHTQALAAYRAVCLEDGPLPEEILALQMVDRFDEAATLIAESRRDHEAPSLMHARLWHAFALGRLSDAEAQAQSLISASREYGTAAYGDDATALYAAIALLHGDVHAARLRLGSTVSVVHGWIAAQEGNAAEAVELLSPLAHTGHWAWLPEALRDHVGIGLAAGDADFLGSALKRAEEAAARNAGVASYEGVALQAIGLARGEGSLLLRAAETIEYSPRAELRARAWADYGTHLLRDGARSEGADCLERAWKIYEEMGARQGLRRLQRTVREAGLRGHCRQWTASRARSAHGWAAVTEAEMKVAEWISAGYTNKSVARKLGISPNTVGTHVRSVFAKLQVQSRVQLANVLRARQSEHSLSGAVGVER